MVEHGTVNDFQYVPTTHSPVNPVQDTNILPLTLYMRFMSSHIYFNKQDGQSLIIVKPEKKKKILIS